MESCDIGIVGAGAAGLTAAIFAAQTCRSNPSLSAARIVVLDGAQPIGAKILIAGGGRCNVTNAEVTPGDFNGSRHIIRNVLAAFDVAATRQWFASLGVELKCEDGGKLFPVTNRARTVLGALLRRCAELDVSIRPGERVRAVRPAHDGQEFVIAHASGSLRSAQVILATGGRSLPRTGSDGSGWALARHLGHTVTDVHPALVPLVLDERMFHRELSGVSQPVELSTIANGKCIDRRRGSLLWTHFGVSGPVVLDASRHWILARAEGADVALRCSFLPGESFERAEAWMRAVAAQSPRRSLARCLAQRLPERVAVTLARRAECDPMLAVGGLTRPQRRALVHVLTALPLPVSRDRGWDFAEVTAGGVPLHEIDYRRMESRKQPGLYLVGEMLDCDGRIGGFNFQWAWSSGCVAGRAAGTECAARHIGHRVTTNSAAG